VNDLRNPVELQVLKLVAEPTPFVYEAQVVAMMLQSGTVEVGFERNPLEQFSYAAGDVVLCGRLAVLGERQLLRLHAGGGPGRCLDPGPARSGCRSDDPAPRGVKRGPEIARRWTSPGSVANPIVAKECQ
jgi:hypothetical protein